MEILVADAFVVQYIYHRTKKFPGKLVFGQDMIPPINHVANRIYIYQHKQAQIEKDIIRGKKPKTDNHYRVGD